MVVVSLWAGRGGGGKGESHDRCSDGGARRRRDRASHLYQFV